MLGALYGDIVGYLYEKQRTEKSESSLNEKSTLTGSSVFIAATSQVIIEYGENISFFNVGRMAKDYATGYRDYYSYFPEVRFEEEFVKWVKADRIYPAESIGTYTPVCAVPIGYAFNTLEQTLKHVKANCRYTNNNKEALKGANAVALAVYLARNGESKKSIRRSIEKKTGYDLSVSLKTIRKTGNSQRSISYDVPVAIISFLESSDYISALKGAITHAKGIDTRTCIAGGIAEAFYRDIPSEVSEFCDDKIYRAVKETVIEFNSRFKVNE